MFDVLQPEEKGEDRAYRGNVSSRLKGTNYEEERS